MIHLLIKSLYNRLRGFLDSLLGKVVILMIIFIVIGTFGFYLLEYPQQSLFESFYWTIITITTIGFGDIHPQTMGGQGLAIILAFFGVALISLTLATIMQNVIQTKYFLRRKFKKMLKKLDEITLICGFNKRIEILIRELTTEGIKVVLINNAPIPDDWDPQWGPYIQGDPTDDEILLEAGVERASKALVSLNDDGDTLLAILSIQAMNRDCYTIAEVTSCRNVQHFKRLNCSQIICQEEILGKFLNITLLLPDLYPAYEELISMAGSEIYFLKETKAYLNKTFEETIRLVKEKHDALPIGLIRENKTTLLNPKLNEKIQPDDVILVISETFVE
jgi:voltage-gated potassium channel